MPTEIKDHMFESEVIKADKPVIVDFYSPSCVPCKVVDQTLTDVEKKLGDSVKIVKINIFQSPTAASTYSIMSVPTVISFKKGRITGHLTGQREISDYLRLVKE